MLLEEIRMNKGLLKEINLMKKEQTNRGYSPSRGPDTDINEIQRQINTEQENILYQ